MATQKVCDRCGKGYPKGEPDAMELTDRDILWYLQDGWTTDNLDVCPDCARLLRDAAQTWWAMRPSIPLPASTCGGD